MHILRAGLFIVITIAFARTNVPLCSALLPTSFVHPHIRWCGKKLLIIIICVNKELNKLKILTNGKVKCDGKNWQSVSFGKS